MEETWPTFGPRFFPVAGLFCVMSFATTWVPASESPSHDSASCISCLTINLPLIHQLSLTLPIYQQRHNCLKKIRKKPFRTPSYFIRKTSVVPKWFPVLTLGFVSEFSIIPSSNEHSHSQTPTPMKNVCTLCSALLKNFQYFQEPDLQVSVSDEVRYPAVSRDD